MFSTAQMVVTGGNVINNIANKFKGTQGDIVTRFQTILENLLLNIDNGTYSVTYCGKGYRNMLVNSLKTGCNFNGTLSIDIDFIYSPVVAPKI
jgi:hypothetical protein